jgi:hypothetical protein
MTLFVTTSRLGVPDRIAVDSDKQIDVYGNGSKQLDLGLLVITDHESGCQPCPLANIRRVGRPFVQSRNCLAIYTDN